MGDAGAREAFVEHLLGGLANRRGSQSLEEALLVLARQGFNLKAASEALGIHLNTLRYRLAKATEALHLDLDDPDTQFQLQLAAKILEYSSKN